jgi:hypothetical protein
MFAVTNSETSPPHRRERAINRRIQGDLGEFSAMEWLASKGALVWIPLGHSPDVDLMAEVDGRLIRVQVKTCTFRVSMQGSQDRWSVGIATNGGNQSWSGESKKFDPTRVDYLFALVGDGRRWFIPAHVLEGSVNVNLGGAKYSEFEIEVGTPIEQLVYPDRLANKLEAESGECLSGQKDVTVNHTAMPTQVRILPPPLETSPLFRDDVAGDVTKSERKLARSGHTLLRQKRQTTIPKRPCAEAGLKVGDRMRVRADGPGCIVFERAEAAEPFSPA